MVNVTEVRPGNAYSWEGEIYSCIGIDLNKTAMAKMKVKIKSKNLRTGAVLEMSFIGGDKVEIIHLEKKKMNYLNDEGNAICFMDNNTYEQISLTKDRLKWEINFLKEGIEVEICEYEGEILGITLPAKVALNITECEPAVRGDTVNKAMKDAYLETGLKIRVPLFIEQGENVWVFTEDGSYDSRAN